MPDLRQPTPSSSPAAVGVDGLRAISARDAGLRHGCILLDIRPEPRSHLPGSSWLPVRAPFPLESELPSHMLPRPGGPLIVCSDEASRSRACAIALRARGWAADYFDGGLPEELLDATTQPGAAWRPDPYLEESMRSLLPGLLGREAVDFGCGNGRNLVYLAQLGLRMLGVDHLPDALRLARQRAAHHAVVIDTLQTDLLHDDPPNSRRFAAAFCVRFTRLQFLERVHEWLLPDGLLLFHGYGLDAGGSHPRTMRRAIRLSDSRSLELFPSERWVFERRPQLHEEAAELWISFVVRRRPG